MFLITFVTLVISIIGLYAQVLSLQASKIYQAQNGLMQTMVAWHKSAAALAKSSLPTNMPCYIPSSTMLAPTVLANPPYPAAGACKKGATPLVLSTATVPPTLPVGYSTGNFSFYSVAFANGSTNYVVTYAYYTDAGNAPTGNLYLPDKSGASVGYSLNSLTQQFVRGATLGTMYGSVLNSGLLSVQPQTIGVTGPMLEYTIPTVIPLGSLGILSSLS